MNILIAISFQLKIAHFLTEIEDSFHLGGKKMLPLRDFKRFRAKSQVRQIFLSGSVVIFLEVPKGESS